MRIDERKTSIAFYTAIRGWPQRFFVPIRAIYLYPLHQKEPFTLIAKLVNLTLLPSFFLIQQSEGEPEEDEYTVPGYERESLAKGMTSMKGRDHAIKCMLDRKQEQFIDLQGYTVFIASWNVNGQSPGK